MTASINSKSNPAAPHLRALLRHFADLRNGTHGDWTTSRTRKEQSGRYSKLIYKRSFRR